MPEPASSTFKAGPDSFTMDCHAGATGPATRPAVVILHGVDGMVGESLTEVRKLADQIASDGFLVFVPHYLGGANGGGMPSKEELIRRTLQVNSYRPRIVAAMDHALAQPGVDATRLGIVGLSLGGGLALWYAETAGAGKTKAVVDFFGHISDTMVIANASHLPPTLVFHNHDDTIVLRTVSETLMAALDRTSVVHDGTIYHEPAYPERYEHTFRPGGKADVDSRSRTRAWLKKHVSA